MTLNLTDPTDDPTDDPTHPIDRPYDVRERSLTPLERLAFVSTSIGDLQKSAAIQEAIVKAFAAGEETVRIGKNYLLNVTEDRAQAASSCLQQINADIEKLSASIEDVAKAYGVKLGSYRPIVIDGGMP